ncbi:MAG: ABC transporter ATP-binding protein [Bdellovibrionales bacterium]|nr:ABC transporter ATP-binding protein [Bdellovibrionales bacterium]
MNHGLMRIMELKVQRSSPGVKLEGELILAPRSLIGLYGPNGSGKTSLMKGLAGLLTPSQRTGFVWMGGETVDLSKVGSDWVRNVLYLGSDFQSPFHVSLREYFEMAAAVSKGGIHLELGSAERTRIALVIEAMGLTDQLNRSVQALSDGEKQWVMIARGLIQKPKLLLLDETCSKLDLDRLIQVASVLKSSIVEDMCIWLSAHDIRFLAGISNSILLFERTGQVSLHQGGAASIHALVERVYPGLQGF